MKEITNPKEIEQMKEDLFDLRIDEQKHKKDYAYLDDRSIEICDDCKSHINSHGHCPRCDY